MAFGQKEGEVFLGRDMTSSRDYSEQTAIEIDAEIRTIVQGQYDRVKTLLTDNRDKLDRIAETLLEYEALDGKEVEMLIEGQTITREKPERRHLSTPEEHRARKDQDNDGRNGRDRKGLLDPFPKPEGAS